MKVGEIKKEGRREAKQVSKYEKRRENKDRNL
jgi:hypothetical protein